MLVVTAIVIATLFNNVLLHCFDVLLFDIAFLNAAVFNVILFPVPIFSAAQF